MTIREISYEHLHRLSDDVGLFEHAELTRPRPEHGYCVDDVARGLIVLERAPSLGARSAALRLRYLRFVLAAQSADGRIHNRCGLDGNWLDESSLDDCWGRAVWAIGTALAGAADDRELLDSFARSAVCRSPHLRAMAFAALGAAEVLAVQPENRQAHELLLDAARRIAALPSVGDWPWPEPRLQYANAVLPEVLIAAGSLFADEPMLAAGLALLDWLLALETSHDRLSVTGVGGWGTGDIRPAFDQQPIEPAALADACYRAYVATGDDHWRQGIELARSWFLGNNDSGFALLDPVSGGGCDGLEVDGRNENQGAESTLAVISVLQRGNRVLEFAAERNDRVAVGQRS